MDYSAFGILAISAVLVSACVIVFLSYLNALRRSGSESRRRLIARAAFITWGALAILTPLILLSALDVLPRWVCAISVIAACIISVLAVRHARRSTMRTNSLT